MPDDPGETRVHAFDDDALGDLDAVGLAALIRGGEVSAEEVAQAAVARASRMGVLNAVAADCYAAPRRVTSPSHAPFVGVPTFIKDNVAVAGVPMQFGSQAPAPLTPTQDEALTQQLLVQGLVVLGKTRMPELGFSPTTGYEHAEPTRNPWNTAYSSGGSSGGAAALVASGVVPIAHGNDGGGSIRIPAANTGLVGLKPTRGRLPYSVGAATMPVKLVNEGVLTRSVRDTAHFYAAAERNHRTKLPPIGLVEGPGDKRLRIGVVFDSIRGVTSCPETRAAVERTAHVLGNLGHDIIPLQLPVPEFLLDDFKLYWGFLAFCMQRGGKWLISRDMNPAKLDGLTRGLADYFKPRAYALPLSLARLTASPPLYARHMRSFDAVLSPVTSHATPRLGVLNPAVPFDTLFERITRYTAFTPLNNATGSPAIAVPAGLSNEGLPIGVQFSAAHGAERTLLELAYTLEAERPFSRIDRIDHTAAHRAAIRPPT